MINEFECKGIWWLPNTDKGISGTLTFHPEQKVVLELIGSFAGFYMQKHQNIILGRTDEGDITLVDNRYRHAKSNSNGITIESFSPNLIFRGHHFESEEEIQFEKAHFIGFNLFPWLNISGLNKKQINDDNSYSINYNIVENLSFEISESCTASIRFISPLNRKREYNHVELSEQCIVTFKYDSSKKYKEILEDITIFIGFITLFTFEQSYPMEIKFTDQQITQEIHGKESKKTIEVLYNHYLYDPKYRVVHSQECLVKYPEIEEEFQQIIKGWFENYKLLTPEHLLVLGYFRDKYKFSPGMFLDFVRAVESYHRNVYKKKRLPDPEFDSMVNKILKRVDWSEKEMEFLRSKLKRGSTILKDRIKYLIKEYNNTYIDSKFKDDQVLIEIVNSRNYYSHLNKEDKENALEGQELFRVTMKILGLLFSCILTDIGVDKSIFEKRLIDQLYE